MKLPRSIDICNRPYTIKVKRYRRMIMPDKDLFGDVDWNNALITIHVFQGQTFDEIKRTLFHETIEAWLLANDAYHGEDTQKRTFKINHGQMDCIAALCVALMNSINEANGL